jgi:hypothetical protein
MDNAFLSKLRVCLVWRCARLARVCGSSMLIGALHRVFRDKVTLTKYPGDGVKRDGVGLGLDGRGKEGDV